MADYERLWDAAWGEAATRGPGFRSRYRILLDRMGRHGVTGRLLEVGAGGGFFLERVAARFPWLELHAHEQSARALERLRTLPCVKTIHEGPLGPAPPPWGERGFHTVLCSEVLEHLDDDVSVLAQLADAVRPGGRLFLTVPMRAELWTAVDDAVGHRRRYEAGQISGRLRALGLEVEAEEQWGFPLYNSYYRLLGGRPPEETSKAAGPLAGFVSGVLTALFVAEARRPSTRGGRGLVVARRPIPLGERGR